MQNGGCICDGRSPRIHAVERPDFGIWDNFGIWAILARPICPKRVSWFFKCKLIGCISQGRHQREPSSNGSKTMDPKYRFDDGMAYDNFMGRRSSAAGAVFLDWIAPSPGARWLDVGCGTGTFTELIVNTCSPGSVFAIDPERAQIDHARYRPVAEHAGFSVANAQALPFEDDSFDIVASGLALNFIPDPVRALSEMLRVTGSAGSVAGYVWDFAAELSPTWPLRLGLRQFGGSVIPTPGTAHTSLDALKSLFEANGLERVATRSIEVRMQFADFDEFKATQMPSFSPIVRAIAMLKEEDRTKLIDFVRSEVTCPDGKIAYSARANAVRGQVGSKR
jgi:ubiquinone/menaquinone biosynthesis C-methylase UbiE